MWYGFLEFASIFTKFYLSDSSLRYIYRSDFSDTSDNTSDNKTSLYDWQETVHVVEYGLLEQNRYIYARLPKELSQNTLKLIVPSLHRERQLRVHFMYCGDIFPLTHYSYELLRLLIPQYVDKRIVFSLVTIHYYQMLCGRKM